MSKRVKVNRRGCIGLAITSVTTLVVFRVQLMDSRWDWLIGLAIVTVTTIYIAFFLEGDRTAKLIKFAEKGDIPKVRKLLDRKTARKVINKMGANGNRLLHYASGEWREPDLVEKIIDLGADVNIKNIWKRTPLHAAAEANNVEAIKSLLNRGADIHSPDINQITPLDIVQKKNRKKTLALINTYRFQS